MRAFPWPGPDFNHLRIGSAGPLQACVVMHDCDKRRLGLIGPLPSQQPTFAMSDFYIPPAEISARLLNFAGQQVLTKGEKGSHSRYGEYTRVGQAPASTDSDEQYWSFEGTGRVRLIRNKSMNKVMLVSSPDEPVPIYLTDGSITKSASAAR